MCKRVILVASLVVVLCLVGNASAVEWSGDGDGTSWDDPLNWTGGVPGPGDDTDIRPPPAQGPIVVDTVAEYDVNCGRIDGPVWSEDSNMVMEIQGGTVVVNGDWQFCRTGGDGIGTVTISGGNVTVNGIFKCSDSFGAYGIMNFTGGSFYSTGDIKIGEDGGGELTISGSTTVVDASALGLACRQSGSRATFNMTGGLLNVRGGFSLGDEQNGDETDPNAIVINFDGGTIICNDFGMQTSDGNTIPFLMEFGENAVLDIGQDRLARIQGYIADGFITGQNDTVEPSVILVKGHTLVGFDLVQEEASGESPPSGTGNLCPNSVTISWTPGTYCVNDHNVYIGTSWDDVNESTTAYRPHYESNSITLTDLEVGRTYFWRVDEVNDNDGNSPWKGSVWHFSTEGGVASDPSPAGGTGRGLKAEDVTSLSWSSHCIADAHNVYFGTDLPASIVLFEDDFESGAFEPNWTATGSWVIFDANGDPPFGGSDANMARATGAGNLTILVDVDATEGDPCVMNISFYFRKTEEITDGEIKLWYHYGGNNWDLIADLNSLPGTNDVWLHYSDTNSNSKYFVNDFKIALQANIISGGTVYIDDVTITNTWPTDWYETRVAGTSHPISVEPMTYYYWRVDTVVDGNVYQGPHWTFSTGYGGLLMYYKFDGTIPNPLPSPIQDDSDNDIEFYKDTDGGGSVTYGESNPVFAGSTASGEFEPNAGLYRLDPCGPSDLTRDILRLDGSEYTVEMWLKPESWTDLDEIWLLYKHGSWGLKIDSLPGCSGEGCNQNYRWFSSGSEACATGNETAKLNEWIYIAVVRDQGGDLGAFYINGNNYSDGGGGPNPPDNNSPIWIGCARLPDGSFKGGLYDGLIDEIRIHDIALRPCEFLLSQVAPEYASCPTPYDGEGELDPCTVELMWTPGEGASSHDIYFSSNYLEVVGGSAVETGWGPSSWTPTAFLPLRDGTVYYWRIDTYDNGGPPYEGAVWKFTTKYVIYDETLLLHYKLDETAGDDAIDASGHGLHGDVDEDDKWDPDGGKFDGCLIFEDDQRIDVPSAATSAITDEITIAVWLCGFDQQSVRDNWVLEFGDEDDDFNSVSVKVPDVAGDVYWRAGNDTDDVLVWDEATPRDWVGDWHHFAFVKDENADTMSIYFNAERVIWKPQVADTLVNTINKPFDIGAVLHHDSDYEGKMDDIRIYNIALSQTQIKALLRGGDLGLAWGPNPYEYQPDAPITTDLSWEPGDYVNDVNGHDVYFGTNWQEVQDANSSSHPNVEYANVTDANYDMGTPLELEKTYYWRVDEVNDSCSPYLWKGKVWVFTVAEYITIDDMEDYTEGWASEHPISDGWQVGGGAMLGLGLINYLAPVRGLQSMGYIYDNSDLFYSEVETLSLDPCDWTIGGVRMLTLWFHGLADNDANETEQLYVGLEDNGSEYAEVRYPMADMNDIRLMDWTVWNIPLNMFESDNPALTLTAIKTLYIGFGDRNGSEAGGVGTVYFDDIRLYRPTCVPWERTPEFAKLDLDNDCAIGFGDVKVMAGDWLESDVNLGQVTNPTDANLVGWWEFDEGDGGIAADSSGNDYNGVIETIENNVWWVDGVNDVNYALDFDGGWVTVADDGNTPELRPKRKVTVMAWINRAYSVDDEEKVVVKGRNDWETYALEVSDENRARFFVRDANDVDNQYSIDSPDELPVNSWVHVAGTYDGNEVTVYVNGQVAANSVHPLWEKLAADANDGFAIAGRWGDSGGSFIGTIDDVRVYDRGLTPAEVAYLATDGTGIFSLQSVADLDKDPPGQGAINFKDLAKLGTAWFDEELYPQ